jgi:hypothetical protein
MKLFLRWCALVGLGLLWTIGWWLGGVFIEALLRSR